MGWLGFRCFGDLSGGLRFVMCWLCGVCCVSFAGSVKRFGEVAGYSCFLLGLVVF